MNRCPANHRESSVSKERSPEFGQGLGSLDGQALGITGNGLWHKVCNRNLSLEEENAMQHILKIIRNLSQHRLGFFYNRENEIYRQDLDALRARAAFHRMDSL
jgi:hypothetical protein